MLSTTYPAWRFLVLVGCYMLACALGGGVLYARHDLETLRDMRREDSLLTVRQESGDARARDSLDTVRAEYKWKADSMRMAWAKEMGRKLKRRAR